ncbi:parapinopsin-like [Saccostrea echinata]|uniref:parapinopsin-like n=1 Tax=Saccostrea echinata TaxID=191078 RepID=UPI002A7ED921|nr:parapinopsin-like [Saccostrea echinata]
MNRTNSSAVFNGFDKLPDAAHYIFGVVYIVLNVIATTGNILVLFVFIKSPKLRSAHCFLVSALCFGDLLMSSVGLTMLIIASFSTYWVLGKMACTFYGTLMTFLGLSQITLLAVIAYTRYLVVVHNNGIGTISAKVIVLACYTYSLCFSLAPLFGWSTFALEPIGTSCGPNWVGITLDDISFNMTLFFLCFLVPLSVILFSYSMVYKKIKKRKIRKKSEGYEIHVTTTILFMIVAFLGSWTPYACMALYIVITRNNRINLVVSAIPLLLAKCSPVWNPYIYFMRNHKFNQECRKLLPFLKHLGLWRVNPREQNVVTQQQVTSSTRTSTYV